MNFKSISLAAAAMLAAFASMPASAITYTFSAPLSGAAEAPPNASTATGLALVSFDDALLTVTVNAIFIGLTGGPANAGHIHCCTSTANTGTAPVVVPFTAFPAVTTGAYNSTFTLSSASFATLLLGTQAGRSYVNIHNGTFGGGEIRGFLFGPSSVPEPGTYALMFSGLAALGLMAKRRQQR